jgi:hypothetical protein
VGPDGALGEATVVESDGRPYYGDLTSDGTDFWITWTDLDAYQVFAARVDGDTLEVGDAAPVSQVYSNNAPHYPTIAWGADKLLVTWQGYGTNSWDVHGRRLSEDLAPLDAADLVLASTAGQEQNPDVAAAGGTFLVSWYDSTPNPDVVQAARVPATGAPGSVFQVHADGQLPQVASNGTDYAVVHRSSTAGTWNCRATRVTGAGATGASVDLAASTTLHECNGGFGVTGKDGGYYAVWYQQDTITHVRGARLTAALGVTDAGGKPLTVRKGGPIQYMPSVAFNGSHYLVVWSDYRNQDTTQWDVYGIRVARDGTLLDEAPFPISVAASHQQEPSVAAVGSEFLVTWYDHRDNYARIYGTRVTSAGARLDGDGVALTPADSQYRYRPVLASNGTEYAVSYQYNSEIRGLRISREGGLAAVGQETTVIPQPDVYGGPYGYCYASMNYWGLSASSSGWIATASVQIDPYGGPYGDCMGSGSYVDVRRLGPRPRAATRSCTAARTTRVRTTTPGSRRSRPPGTRSTRSPSRTTSAATRWSRRATARTTCSRGGTRGRGSASVACAGTGRRSTPAARSG